MAERVRRFRQTDPAALAAAFRVFLEGDLGDRLHKIRAPTLIMTGEHDPIAPAAMSRFMHGAIAGSELTIVPGLRHNILMEAPDIVTDRIAAFLG